MTAPEQPAMFVCEERGEVAVLRMTYGKVSALDAEFCGALTAELKRLEQGAPRAVVLTGTGTTFSAGVNLFRLLDGGADYVREFLPAMDRSFRALLGFCKPIVAAVNGHAIAGGCIMATAADRTIMARGDYRIGVPELAVGVPFPRLPLEIVAARVSPSTLRTLVYSGRVVQPDEAHTIGLVDEIVDPESLLDRAVSIAQELGAIPAKTFALTKRALVASLLERVATADDAAVMAAWHSEEVHEAIRRYLAKSVRRAGGASGLGA